MVDMTSLVRDAARPVSTMHLCTRDVLAERAANDSSEGMLNCNQNFYPSVLSIIRKLYSAEHSSDIPNRRTTKKLQCFFPFFSTRFYASLKRSRTADHGNK